MLLVPGRGDATDVYPSRFSDRLIEAGCRVIRFDPRDAGLSGDGGSAYTMRDMADDAMVVLDSADVGRAHVIGLSMGGMMLVDLATRHRERVASAVFLSAMSPHPDAGFGDDFFADEASSALDAALRAMGPTTAADQVTVADEVAAAARRAPARPEAASKHQEAAFRFGWPELDRLGEIAVPVLVVHGTADRVLPLAHAHALAAGIAASELLVMDTMGHLPRPREWDTIADRVVRLVAWVERGGEALDRGVRR